MNCINLQPESKDARRRRLKRARQNRWRDLNLDAERERSRTWKAENRDRVSVSVRKYELRVKFGLTVEQFESMLTAQGGKCAICPATTPGGRGAWHVDHAHVTGFFAMTPEQKRPHIRGVLCANCNAMLGFARDSIQNLTNGISYLTRA